MAGSWALILGIVRMRTAGLLHTWILHVAADIAIGSTAAAIFR